MDSNTRFMRNYAKQRSITNDWLRRTAGMSLEEISNNKFLLNRMIDNHLYNFYFSMGDNPFAEMQIAKLDNHRLLIDLNEYNEMIKATHTAVKDEAYKAIDEAVSDFIKDFNKK